MLISLTTRSKQIVDILLYSQETLSVTDIAKRIEVNRRSIYYDLCKINEWLEINKIPIIETNGKGILLDKNQKEQIKNILGNLPSTSDYQFSPSERVKIIICSTIMKKDPIYIEDYMNVCKVSRNTIISDLKAVSTVLSESNLELSYENKKGYDIKGDVIKKRSFFFLTFNPLIELYKKGAIELQEKEKIDCIYRKLNAIAKELSVEYVEGVLYSLATFFSTIQYGSEEMVFSIRDKMEISSSQEYALVCEYFEDFSESEKLYLTLHLLGSRLQNIPINLMKEDNQESYMLAKSLVEEFSRIACIKFEAVEELEQALFAHLKTSLYRYRYGIQLENPMLNDIKNGYPDLFELTKKACKYLEQQIRVPIPDGEIAYITLHFGAYLDSRKAAKRDLKILIVCPNGIGTANMLKKEVVELIPNAEIIDVVSLTKYNTSVHHDVIISTIKLEIEEPHKLIVVNPILTDNDRVMILRKCMQYTDQPKDIVEQVMSVAKKFISGNDLELFRKELITKIQPLSVSSKQNEVQSVGLAEVLDESLVMIVEDEMEWRESLHKAGETLAACRKIKPTYIDAVIECFEKLGPYMFITKDIVLAHAKPEDGVLKLGVSVTVYKKPVRFSDEKNAKVIITLATPDQISHLHILKDIMEIGTNQDFVQRISSAKTNREVLDIITSVIGREER